MGYTYYHYTSLEGAKGIRRDKMIYASLSEHGDAAFGNGVYLTQLSPEHNGRTAIFVNNYDGIIQRRLTENELKRTEVAIKITFPRGYRLPEEKYNAQGRDIHLYKGDLNLQYLDVKIIYLNPEGYPAGLVTVVGIAAVGVGALAFGAVGAGVGAIAGGVYGLYKALA